MDIQEDTCYTNFESDCFHNRARGQNMTVNSHPYPMQEVHTGGIYSKLMIMQVEKLENLHIIIKKTSAVLVNRLHQKLNVAKNNNNIIIAIYIAIT